MFRTIKNYLYKTEGLVLILSLLFFMSSCHKQELVHTISGRTMGTTYTIKYVAIPKLFDSKLLKKEIDKVLIEVNRQMSTYIKTSEISSFNNSKTKTWFKVSNDFFHVTSHAIEVAKQTNGVFDPTIGPLVNLWGFGPDGKRKVPTEKQILETRKRVGFQHLKLNKQNLSIQKNISNLYLDLSASAKGFGVDAVSKYLKTKNIKNFMVEIGGEVGALGKKPNGSWKIAIEAPDPINQGKPYQKVIELKNQFMATSGDYRNFFEDNGKRYSHTINYQTGKPVENTLASVTVIHKSSAMEADSWATALMALGARKGLELAEKHGLAAYFIYRGSGQETKSFIEKASSQFKAE